MINKDAHQWDFTKEEKFAIAWFEERGFDVVIEKHYISKDILTISKDGYTDQYHLPLGDKDYDYKKVLAQFEKQWELFCSLQDLKKRV